jgi:sugar-specific transcriptional regulator TrmB
VATPIFLLVDENKLVELLQQTGMSAYESRAYIALVGASRAMNGYEVSKTSGVPRSAVYEALSKLASRGVAHVISESDGSSRYIALDPERFVTRLRSRATETIESLENLLTEVAGARKTTVNLHVNGRAEVRDRFIDVINNSRESCWLSIWPRGADELREAVRAATERGVEVTSIVFGEAVDFPGRVIEHRFPDATSVLEAMGCLFYVAVGDRREAIIGIRENRTTWGVWSDDLAVVALSLQYIFHDISTQAMGQRLSSLGEPHFLQSQAAESDVLATALLGGFLGRASTLARGN